MNAGRNATVRAVGVALAAWAVWWFFGLAGPVDKWRPVLRGIGEIELAGLLGSPLAGSLLRTAVLLVLGIGFAAAAAGTGRLALRWWRLPRAGELEALSLGVLSGFGMIGTWYLGLALTGLFYPAALVLSVLPGIAVAGARWRGVHGIVARMRPDWTWLAIAPAAVAAVAALAPDTYSDTYFYHLAVPELLLKVHRFPPTPAECPLSAELVYALGLLAGDDALPHLLQAAPFLAAVGLLAAWAGRVAGRPAAVLAVLLVLTLGETERQMQLAKNNLAAAAFPVAAAVCAWRGRGSPAWLLMSAAMFGLGAAHKWSGYLLLALGGAATCVVLLRRGRASLGLAWALVAAAPLAPWLAKAWFNMGDPVWPFLSRWLPGAMWDAESAAGLALERTAMGFGASVRGFWPHWMEWWLLNQPVVALLFPACLLRMAAAPASARTMLAAAIGVYAVFWLLVPGGEAPRLGLPVLILGAAATGVAAVALARDWPRRAARAAFVAAGATMWLPLGFALRDADPPALAAYLAGRTGRAGYLSGRLTTYAAAGNALGRFPGVGGVITLGGDRRVYRVPGRPWYGRTYGRNWAWVLARECSTRGEIRKRFRQLRCRHVLYNFVTGTFPHPWAAPFRWDGRMLELWHGFVARDLDLAVRPGRVDPVNGGFCVYVLREEPRARPVPLAYLPGIESLYYDVTRHGEKGDMAAWLRAARALLSRLPDVDGVRDLVAQGYWNQGRWQLAYDHYRPGIARGTVTEVNLWYAGVAAAYLGKWEEAEELVRRAVELSPHLAGKAEALRAEMRRGRGEGK